MTTIKKLTLICNNSGLSCENYGYQGKHKHLPHKLRWGPQHIVYDDKNVKLVYFKASFDVRFVELFRDEIETIRKWNFGIHPVLVFVYNYKLNRWTTFDMEDINTKMFICTKETIDKFLFSNVEFEWKLQNDKLKI